MKTEGEVLLRAERLSKSFALRRTFGDMVRRSAPRSLRAVQEVSFDVARGETLGVVGESGCGKSTLARCLVRLHEPDSGSLSFAGQNVLSLSGSARRSYNRRVQMIFQDPYSSLNPRMTVRDCLAEAIAVHRIVPSDQVNARVERLLDLVHLPREAAARHPHEFSGGQRQRIGIARALAVEPEVLIADEPVSALDVSVQAQIVNLLLELQGELGLAIIFITHDLRLVHHISHRIAVMYLGRIVEIGPTRSIFATPRHPYTRALLEAVPRLVPGRRAGKAALSGELPSPLAPPPGCPFHTRCPMAQPICREQEPALEPRDGDWPSACHFADAVSPTPTDSQPHIVSAP